MKITCNNCNKKARPKVRERKLDNGIVESYLKCPKCKEETRIALTNNEIRNLHSKRDFYIASGYISGVRKVSQEIKIKMDILNGKS